jgi:hypothetical protein
MAPEMIDEDETAMFFPADVYSYAIMFWEIVVGKRWKMQSHYRSQVMFLQDVRNARNPHRPPLAEVSLETHKHLLQRMWDSEPGERPRFA